MLVRRSTVDFRSCSRSLLLAGKLFCRQIQRREAVKRFMLADRDKSLAFKCLSNSQLTRVWIHRYKNEDRLEKKTKREKADPPRSCEDKKIKKDSLGTWKGLFSGSCAADPGAWQNDPSEKDRSPEVSLIFALVHRTGETESGATGAGLSRTHKTVASPLKLHVQSPTLTCTPTRQALAQRDESGEGRNRRVFKCHLISSQWRHPHWLFLPTDTGGKWRWELWHGASHDVDEHPLGLQFSSDSERKVEIERGAACPACVKDSERINTHRNWAAECNLTKTTVNVSDICSYRTSILFHYYVIPHKSSQPWFHSWSF